MRRRSGTTSDANAEVEDMHLEIRRMRDETRSLMKQTLRDAAKIAPQYDKEETSRTSKSKTHKRPRLPSQPLSWPTFMNSQAHSTRQDNASESLTWAADTSTPI